MPLSPLEIRNQDFAKAPWGYKRDEVKFFLAQVAEAVAELNKERDQLARRLEGLMKRVSELEAQSGAIGQALELARKESEQILAEANKQAAHIRENADAEAQKVMDQYAVQINETKQELYELTTIKDSYFRKLLRILELQEDALRRFDEEYEARRLKSSIASLASESLVEFPLSDSEVFSNLVHRRKREVLFESE
ncbi:hypothetical protein DRQ36_04275 [bacterium]|nr:MAG: hypothetical protein DRQ36_04275 [bacterium]